MLWRKLRRRRETERDIEEEIEEEIVEEIVEEANLRQLITDTNLAQVARPLSAADS